jgi:hypothetical protein
LVSLAKKPSTALGQDAEVGVHGEAGAVAIGDRLLLMA